MIRSYSEDEKMAYVEEFKNSELGVTTFARQNGIPESTFRGWLKDISDLSFGMINLKPTPSAVPKITKNIMVFANETIRIELKENFDKSFLRKVVEINPKKVAI